MDGRGKMDFIRLLKVMRGSPIMDPKWNPMADDYTNQSFNSYNRGPASGLGVSGAGRGGPPRRHRLFVGSLPKEMTNKGLENLFSSVATVTDCYVKPSDRPNTYGFVTVSSVKDVENCIAKLNGHQLKDHSISVSMAREGPNENRDGGRDGGRPPFRPSPSGDARGMRGASAPRSLPSNMNNGVNKMNSNGHSKDETREAIKTPVQQTPVQQTSPMSSMVTAGCEECQRHLMALMTHMQQAHSQGAMQGATSPKTPSPDQDIPYNGPSRAHKADHQQEQQQVNSLSTRGQSPAEVRGQAQSFQQSPRGSAFSRPSPKKSPGSNKPVAVPLSKEQDNGSGATAKTPGSEKNKAECDLKPCEACEKPGKKHCSKCGVTYCSVECQKGDWKKHKSTCKMNLSYQNDVSPPDLTSDNLKYVEPTKKEMKAIVTHVSNPGSFWVQVADQSNIKLYSQIHELVMEQVAVSEPLQDPKPGVMCISKYAVDDSWYRSMIHTVDKAGTASILMMDFGNSERVSFKDLRPATTQIMDFPVMGIHCAIADVEPRGSTGKWCSDSVKLFEMLVKESQMSIVHFQGKKAGIYQVILKTQDDKSGTISVGDALIKHELAWPKGSQPVESPRKALMKSSMKRMQIPLGREPVKIAINNYTSPKEMQCQIMTHQSMEALVELSSSLNACIGAQPQQSGFTPKLGEVCAGRFTQDDQWYRVFIQSPQIDGGYFVEYLDFGNTEVLEASRMCHLPTQFHDIPQQSFTASFAGLPSGDISGDLSKAVAQRLGQCREGFFLATFTQQKDDIVFMTVQDPDTMEDIAQAVGLIKAKGHQVSDMTFRAIHPNADTQFVITEAVSPAEFYGFSPSDNESSRILGLLAEGAQEVGSQPVEQNFRPSVGDLCWAQFSVDKDWYRASVLQELPNDQFDVQYIDYGNGEKVHLSVMKPMSNNMAAVPVLGIKCCIAGLPSYTGPWSSEVTESLKEMTGVGTKQIIIRALEKRNNVTYMQLEDPSTGLNISQEIINLVKESSNGMEPSSVSGPSSLSSHPSLGHGRSQPSTPANQPRSAPALSPQQLQSMEEQLAMLQAQLQQAKGMSA